MSDWKTEYERRVRAVVQKKLGSYASVDSADVVTIVENFNEGYACCGGRDPDCYCSFAESASHELRIHVGAHSYTYYSDKYGKGALVQFLDDLMGVE